MIRRFGLVLFMLWSVPAAAQEISKPLDFFDFNRSYRANPYYEDLAGRAMAKQSDDFPFGNFRKFYLQTRQYEPIATRLNKELLGLAYKIQTSQDFKEVEESQHTYDLLVFNHLANIGVVMQAKNLAMQDARFGSPTFYAWLETGLMRNVVSSGNGRTSKEAFDVITLEEEELLLRNLNLRLLQQDVFEGGIMIYHYDQVEDLETGEVYNLVVNATYPLLKLRKEEEKKEYKVDIRKQ